MGFLSVAVLRGHVMDYCGHPHDPVIMELEIAGPRPGDMDIF